jgi:hypothetical protein
MASKKRKSDQNGDSNIAHTNGVNGNGNGSANGVNGSNGIKKAKDDKTPKKSSDPSSGTSLSSSGSGSSTESEHKIGHRHTVKNYDRENFENLAVCMSLSSHLHLDTFN